MAEVTVIRVFSSGTGATDSAANVDMPEDGDIVGVHGLLTGKGMDADGDQAMSELSFLSTSQYTTNDARGSIMKMRLQNSVATVASITQNALSEYMNLGPDGLPINAGERLHLHRSADTGVTADATFDIYFRVRKSIRRSRRRR